MSSNKDNNYNIDKEAMTELIEIINSSNNEEKIEDITNDENKNEAKDS